MSTKTRNYQVDYSRYTFKEDDDWGDYDNGKYREPSILTTSKYRVNNYWCTDGKRHSMNEHIAKWEYFNGEIPEGMEIDHIIPISNGGTNKLSNLRLLSHCDNNRNELTRRQRSQSHTGKWINREDQSRSVSQFTLDGELVKIYPSISEAVRLGGFDRTSIIKCCNGGRYVKGKWVKITQHKGYKWNYDSILN